MDVFPTKKRRTSLTTSIAVNPREALNQPVVKDRGHTSPSRASFLSPTKASLARFNPELLRYPPSVGEGARRIEGTRFSAAPRRRSHTPGRPPSLAKTAPVNFSIDTVIPTSFESPDEVEEREQENVTEQLEHELQTNAAQRSSVLDDLVETAAGIMEIPKGDELELPLTPTQLGLEPVPEPPKGLLFSSPSRRVTRRKGQNIRFSPLKPRNTPPPEAGRKLSPSYETQATIEMQDSRPDVSPLEDVEHQMTQDIYSQLSLQLKYLQDDITQLETEVNRRQDGSAVTPARQKEIAQLISILASENPTHKPIPRPPKSVPLSIRLSLFLPFSKSKPPMPKILTTDEPPRSHHPIQLMDPLSYLRSFTPLNIGSTESFVSSSTSDNLHFRHQVITFASPHELLVVKLGLTTNTVTHVLDSLTLAYISPWADPELGSWVRKNLADGDVSSIGYAIGRYWEIASSRDRCWRTCYNDYGELLPCSDRKSAAPSTKKQPVVSRKGRRRISNLSETAESESNLDTSATSPATPSSNRLADLSQQSLLLARSGVSLLVSWHIHFDWTGEVESHISACPSFPTAWNAIDEMASLGKVGKVFERLVVKRGFREAVRIVVGLLFRDEA